MMNPEPAPCCRPDGGGIGESEAAKRTVLAEGEREAALRRPRRLHGGHHLDVHHRRRGGLDQCSERGQGPAGGLRLAGAVSDWLAGSDRGLGLPGGSGAQVRVQCP